MDSTDAFLIGSAAIGCDARLADCAPSCAGTGKLLIALVGTAVPAERMMDVILGPAKVFVFWALPWKQQKAKRAGQNVWCGMTVQFLGY
jgi:hypothetical protein